MEGLVKGDIVVISFPYSDYSGEKRRPALVVSVLEGNDAIISEITSKIRLDDYSIKLTNDDLIAGKLNVFSMIRPNKIATVDRSAIAYKFGSINQEKIKEVEDSIIRIIRT